MYSDYTPRAVPSSPVFIDLTQAQAQAQAQASPSSGSVLSQQQSALNVLLLDLPVINIQDKIKDLKVYMNKMKTDSVKLDATETIEIRGPHADQIKTLYLSFHNFGDWASLKELYGKLFNSIKHMPDAVRMTELAATEFIATEILLSSPNRFRIFASVNSVTCIFSRKQLELPRLWLFLHTISSRKITELLTTQQSYQGALDDAGLGFVSVDAGFNNNTPQQSNSKPNHSRVRKQTPD